VTEEKWMRAWANLLTEKETINAKTEDPEVIVIPEDEVGIKNEQLGSGYLDTDAPMSNSSRHRRIPTKESTDAGEERLKITEQQKTMLRMWSAAMRVRPLPRIPYCDL